MFVPLAGDLLFQYRQDGVISRAVGQTAKGINGYPLNHVGLAVDSRTLIEASTPRVRRVGVSEFLHLSCCDAKQRPQVVVLRVKEELRHIIAQAVKHAAALVGYPYDVAFSRRKEAYYCSELIVDSFNRAASTTPIFSESPMSFKNPKTGETLPFWIDHYKKLGLPIPQGELGSHPAKLSQSDNLEIVHQYGSF